MTARTCCCWNVQLLSRALLESRSRTKSNLSFVKQHRPELFKAQGGSVHEEIRMSPSISMFSTTLSPDFIVGHFGSIGFQALEGLNVIAQNASPVAVFVSSSFRMAGCTIQTLEFSLNLVARSSGLTQRLINMNCPQKLISPLREFFYQLILVGV